MKPVCFKAHMIPAAVAAVLLGHAGPSAAATTLSVEATADTFLTNDSRYINSNMSGYGAMMISAPVQDLVQGISEYRTMENLVAYNSASIKAGFDAQYGAGNWHVTDVQLKWYTNFDIPGVPANNNQFNVPATGYFNIAYFGNDGWFNPATAGASGLTNPDLTWNSVYGGGTYSNLFSGQVLEGTFHYPGGTYNGTTDCYSVPDSCAPRYWDLSLTSDLANDIASGGYLSFHGYAADDQVVYLVNQLTKPGAHPQIFVTADAGASAPAAVPLPAAFWLFGSALAGLGVIGRRTGASIGKVGLAG
jgi:hypothetical protein